MGHSAMFNLSLEGERSIVKHGGMWVDNISIICIQTPIENVVIFIILSNFHLYIWKTREKIPPL